ncbi:MAG: putative toxin-antitoxin system toxin component, PIN family [Dehalococcoidia bacterium]
MDAWRGGRFKLVTSEPLLIELRHTLTYPRIASRLRLDEPALLLTNLRLRAQVVQPSRTVDICRDPADNRVLEAAVAGAVDYVVTGDKDLLVLGAFEGIPIVDPATFLAVLDAQSPDR